jgi:hypothetical protein
VNREIVKAKVDRKLIWGNLSYVSCHAKLIDFYIDNGSLEIVLFCFLWKWGDLILLITEFLNRIYEFMLTYILFELKGNKSRFECQIFLVNFNNKILVPTEGV